MKYIEIYNDLKRAILRREIAPNDAVPSEKALTIKYKVSRITAKHALNELATQGLIYRIQGKGSFVKPNGTIKSHQILLVLPFSGNNKLGNYVAGIQEVLKDTTWKLLSITDTEFLNMDVNQLKENYAGMIYYSHDLTKDVQLLLKIYLNKFPIVLLDQTFSDSIIPSVISDNVGGGFIATQHLVESGRHKVAFYAQTDLQRKFTGSVADRFLGYVKALRKFNINKYDPFQLLLDLQNINDEYLVQFIKDKKIDAILAENDIIAFKLMNILQKGGISIPNDLALIGFDNLPLTQLTSPKLSSVGQNFTELGTNAVNLLLRQINNPTLLFNKKVTVPVQLIKRESTLGA